MRTTALLGALAAGLLATPRRPRSMERDDASFICVARVVCT